MATIMLFLTNLVLGMRNLGRRLRRRRIDWVRMDLAGALPELADEPPWWQRRIAGAAAPLSLQALRRRLERLADDGQIRGVLLVVRDLSAGWAAIEGLHEALRTFRDTGKRVVAYLPTADTRAYMAACGADAILMPPTSYLNLVGLRVEATFLADALRLVGLEAEVIAVSPYKSGGDQLARASISPEGREQLERLVDDRFARLVATVAAARGMSPSVVRALVDRAPLLATDARDVRLLDAALYEDELEGYLGQGAGSPAKLAIIQWSRAARVLPLPLARRQRRYVGVVRVEGAIAQGASRRSPLPLPLIGGSIAGADSVIQALRQAEASDRVGAVVLHIDSPGGDAFASDLIWREALRLGRRKPLVVSMGDVAASGGYYIAAPARAIFARPATLTGSIGVYSLRPNAAALLERVQVGTAVVSRGANSGLFSPSEPLSDGERATLRRFVFEIYDAFKDRVRSGRGLSDEQLEPIAGGRVWTGREAAQLGLVDDLGGFTAAVARARSLADLPPDPRAPILVLRSGRSPVPPQPFPPPQQPADLLSALLGEALQTRTLAALPWVLREL
ncbi:MAG: signal peptide peptidase SppA [Chloroflexales bacterium]|nr:signal peptide peptidase SppA [Chloroflexales bacterium]